MKKGDVIRQKCVNTTFYLTGILAHKVNNTKYYAIFTLLHTIYTALIEFHDDNYKLTHIQSGSSREKACTSLYLKYLVLVRRCRLCN